VVWTWLRTCQSRRGGARRTAGEVQPEYYSTEGGRASRGQGNILSLGAGVRAENGVEAGENQANVDGFGSVEKVGEEGSWGQGGVFSTVGALLELG